MQVQTRTETLAAKVPLGKHHRRPGLEPGPIPRDAGYGQNACNSAAALLTWIKLRSVTSLNAARSEGTTIPGVFCDVRDCGDDSWTRKSAKKF
jgi:hypothetical protein